MDYHLLIKYEHKNRDKFSLIHSKEQLHEAINRGENLDNYKKIKPLRHGVKVKLRNREKTYTLGAFDRNRCIIQELSPIFNLSDIDEVL